MIKTTMLSQVPKVDTADTIIKLQYRIFQTNEDISNLENNLQKYAEDTNDTAQIKQYKYNRRQFCFKNLQILKKHLEELLKKQVYLKSITQMDANDMMVVVTQMEKVNEETLEIMKSIIEFQEEDNESLGQSYMDTNKFNQRIDKSYEISNEAEHTIQKKFLVVNDYLKEQVYIQMNAKELPSQFRFIPKTI